MAKKKFWSSHECSPIFLQFIDCVHQLLDDYPEHFEFSDQFLVSIMDNVYGCSFGTFLFNNENERNAYQVKERTPSLWNWMNDPQTSEELGFRNNAYEPEKSVEEDCLDPKPPPELWRAYYFRTKGAAIYRRDTDALKNQKMGICEHPTSLLDKIQQLLNMMPGAHYTVNQDGSKRIVIAVENDKGTIPIIEDYDPNRSEEQLESLLSHSIIDTSQNPSFDYTAWARYFSDSVTSMFQYIPSYVDPSSTSNDE